MASSADPTGPQLAPVRTSRFAITSLVCYLAALLYGLTLVSMKWSGGGGASPALAVLALALSAPVFALVLAGIVTSFIALTRERHGPLPIIAAAISFTVLGYLLEAIFR